MSRRGLARHNARRDANEPLIVAAFEAQGWTVVKLSGKGLPDLLCMKNTQILGPQYILVDVKMPKGEFKPAQVATWKDWSGRGLPVYVATTVDDVLAIIAGTARPWGEMNLVQQQRMRRIAGSGEIAPLPGDFEAEVRRRLGVRAAQSAEETFASRSCRNCDDGLCSECTGVRI